MTERATTTMEPRARALALLRMARAGLVRVALATAPGLRALGRFVASHRRGFLAIGVRVAFWGALALWLTTALTVVGGTPLDIELALHRFVVGAGICAVAVLLAVARHVRWASWALGSLHGGSATVLWLLVSA